MLGQPQVGLGSPLGRQSPFMLTRPYTGSTEFPSWTWQLQDALCTIKNARIESQHLQASTRTFLGREPFGARYDERDIRARAEQCVSALCRLLLASSALETHASTALEAYMSEHSTWDTTLHNVATQVDARHQEASVLHETLTRELRVAEAEAVELLDARLQAIHRKFEGAYEALVEEANAVETRLRKEVDTLRAEMRDAAVQHDKLRTQLATLIGENAAQKAELDQLRETAVRRAAAHEVEVARAANDRAESEATRAKERDKLAHLEGELASSQAEISKLHTLCHNSMASIVSSMSSPTRHDRPNDLPPAHSRGSTSDDLSDKRCQMQSSVLRSTESETDVTLNGTPGSQIGSPPVLPSTPATFEPIERRNTPPLRPGLPPSTAQVGDPTGDPTGLATVTTGYLADYHLQRLLAEERTMAQQVARERLLMQAAPYPHLTPSATTCAIARPPPLPLPSRVWTLDDVILHARSAEIRTGYGWPPCALRSSLGQ